jgi:hypothetical protein
VWSDCAHHQRGLAFRIFKWKSGKKRMNISFVLFISFTKWEFTGTMTKNVDYDIFPNCDWLHVSSFHTTLRFPSPKDTCFIFWLLQKHVFWKIEEENIAAFTRVISAPLFHEFGEKTNIDFGLSHCIERLQPNIVELIMKHCNTRAVLTN